MNIAEKRLHSQIQTWTLIGPIISSIAVGLLLFKASIGLLLALAILAAFLLSWMWQERGLVIAIGLFIATFFYHYKLLDYGERLWHIGFYLSLLLASAITALSSAELHSLIHATDTKSHPADNELEILKQRHTFLESQFAVLEKRLRDNKQSLEQSLHKATEELRDSQQQRDHLMNDLVQTRSETANIHQQLKELQTQQQALLQQSDAELSRKLQQQEQNQLNALQQKTQVVTELSEKLQQQEQEMADLQQRFLHVQSELTRMQQQLVEAQHKIQEQPKLESIPLETIPVPPQSTFTTLEEAEQAWRRSTGLYHQLREQFAQKDEILDNTRHQLFQAEERFLVLQKQELEAQDTENRAIETLLQQVEHEQQQLQQEVNSLEDLVSTLS